MASYVYSSLGSDPKGIRVVRLTPSNNAGLISIRSLLIETTWDKCEYEALSYCWGKQGRTKSILLDGGGFQVTEDLYDALQYLCLQGSSRTLWIDAICINQKDPDEKSTQVRRMQDIFKNAKRVVVWVGQAKKHTEWAFKQVERLLGYADTDSQQEIWNEPGEWITCLNEIIKRPYWTRAWTVQEVALAQAAVLCCGSYTLPFFDFAKFLIRQSVRSHLNVEYALSSYLRQVFEMREDTYQDPPLGLFELAYKLRYRQSTDPHDKVYAFLGLLKSTGILSAGRFAIDYSTDVDKLWMTFAKETMSRYNTLLPLALAENSRSIQARWCYQWSNKAHEPNSVLHNTFLFWTGGWDSPEFYPLQAPRHSAANGLPARIRTELEAPSVISVQGFSVGRIVKTGSSVNSLLTSLGRPNYVQLFEEWESLVGGPWDDPERTSRFAHTVTGGAWSAAPADWRAWNKKNYSEKVWSWEWYMRNVVAETKETTGYRMSRHDEPKENAEIVDYYRIRDHACEERRMFLLENGEYGLGPEGTKVSDQVAVLLGCEVPLILHTRDYTGYRRMFDDEHKARLYGSTWKLVGQAYVHGRMKYLGDLQRDIDNGEVVLEEYLLD